MSRRSRPNLPAPEGAADESAIDPTWFDDVAGHRVVRRLSVGSRATLLLAHAAGRGAGEGSHPRVLKVFTKSTSTSSVDVELAALSNAAIPHVVRLLDVASIDTGAPPCLVLERLAGPTLSAYLAEEASSLSAGQAVTILAPLCATLQSLHDTGVTHGALHVRRIVFDERGAPTLTGFGRGALRQPPQALHSAAWTKSHLERDEHARSREASWRAAVLADQRDLLDIVDEVFAHVDPEQMPTRIDTVDLSRSVGDGPSRAFLPRLEQLLFAVAPPQAVATAASATESTSRSDEPRQMTTLDEMAEHRALAAVAPAAEYDWAQPAPALEPTKSEPRVVAALRVLGLSSTGLEFASSAVDFATRFTTKGRSRKETPSTEQENDRQSSTSRRWGRKPVLVGASCAVVATTALLLVLPPSNDGAQAGAERIPSSLTPTEETAPGGDTPPALPDATLVLKGDDPAAALQVLSLMNDECAGASEQDACLTTIFQEDFLEAQQAAQAALVIEATEAVVTGSWGGSALVAARLNGQPASFLLLKGEAGWRVRDVFTSD